MALPQGFNEWKLLRDMILKEHNKLVASYFKNQAVDSVGTTKEKLRHSCTIKNNDTVDMVKLRLWLFEVTVGHAQSLQAPIYGTPVDVYQSNVEFKPQVHLHFQERFPYIADRLRPVRGLISFVLPNETGATYSRSKAEALALDIKREFGNPIFVWEKGKYYYYYRDKNRGYDLRLLVKNKFEGERITKAVLGINGHPFSDDFSDYMENTRSYPNNTGTQIIYGQSQPKPIKRPTADVRFRYAQLLLHGRAKVINLVSTPGVALKQVIQRLSVS
ncbi:hypothetical protein FJR38_26920 [Anabaena sp. UHCC 0253]|uniref:hypothetical protein n=1 Tax=Anabaena sp. UHCC 0253 TaxID=2590019 RepID=UPI0014478F80|nr:hypothetical protein [Anabaena sp. UHCC 0253]MTJ56023.1 hypothetical protein [Anabaena sp. UHCC 0253]